MNTETFVTQLRTAGLLFDKRLARAVMDLSGGAADGRSLARELLRLDLLTPFQANQVLIGKGRGLMLGQYRLLERLGHGSMGQVYKAVHVAMGRLVAVRMLPHQQAADPEARTRFNREVRILAGLSHPYIPAAFDAFEVEGVSVLVMEFVEGISLARLVAEAGPLPAEMACLFVSQAARALQHAHGLGLECGHVKPERLLITGYQSKTPNADITDTPSSIIRGCVKVVDLGLVLPFEDKPASVIPTQATSRPDIALDPADFAAPEQFDTIGPTPLTAIVYRLGCILYFALAGRPPFPGGSWREKRAWHQGGEPTSLTSLRPNLPSQLVATVRHMMAKEPAERIPTPTKAAAELASFCPPGTVVIPSA